MSVRRTAVIVGAGIGGLAAGLVLRKAGWEVRIHERAASPRELGFALRLAPNALAALGEMGLADTMVAAGVVTTKVEIRRTDGRVLRKLDAQPGGPMVVALRTALHGALLDAVGADALRLNSEAVDVTSRASDVRLALANGSADTADVVIGADGVGSAIRTRLHPQEPPARASGFCAFRGVTYGAEEHLGDLAAVGYLGEGIEGATARASHDAIYWYLSLLAQDVLGDARDLPAVLKHTAGFDARFRAIIAATQPGDMRFDQLLVRDPLTTWGAGRITLLGDAAHPLLPHTGQGAAQALEDAVALGLALSGRETIEAALRRYEQVRSRRTRSVMAMGPRIARLTTTRNPLLTLFRTAAVRWLPEAVLVRPASPRRDPHQELRDR